MLTEKTLNSLSQLPGPKGLPVLGNLLQIDLHKLHSILEEWSDIYGDMYKFKIANKTVVAISDPTLIQNILRDRPQTYRRVSSIERVARELGIHGVFSAEKEQWQRQRLLTMQAFKPDYLRRFFPDMLKITERLKNRWSKIADSGQSIDVQQDCMRFTVDITTNFAFGYDINLLEQENDSFQRHLERLLPAFNRRANAPFPYWHFVKLPSDRAMEKSLAVVKETIHEFVQQNRQRLEQQPEVAMQPANFLEALLLAHDEDGARLSETEIQGNIITILLAGEDTTAHTLSWLLYLITEHPEVQHKMQQEADAVLGPETTPPDISTVEKLNYIEAVAHETLRLKSVTPLLFMEPNREVELAGIPIPKGTFLMLVNRYGALQEENFTDARKFKPERWLESNPGACAHNRNASIPFGVGPRFCPGRNLALLEIKTAMAMLCKNFSVTRVETGLPVQEIFSFTMMPDNLRVKFSAR
ncbi:MAG: cytochrome P450 [Methylococcaceae bacterium]|nr:cytochrome P450 [Methylococcaceae bacterium]